MELLLAVPPQTNEAFLREVDEELRREQLVNFWRRYGRVLAIGIAVALAALAGVLWWQHHKTELAAEQSAKFTEVYDMLAAGKTAEAQKPLKELSGSDNPTYRALARYIEADVLLRDSAADAAKGAPKLREAAAKFASVASDASVAQPFRDLALIRQTYAEFDGMKPQAVVDRLRPLATKGQPWFGSAGELIALAQIQQGNKAAARSLLGQIAADETVPDSVRQRAVQLAGSIGDDAPVAGGEQKAK